MKKIPSIISSFICRYGLILILFCFSCDDPETKPDTPDVPAKPDKPVIAGTIEQDILVETEYDLSNTYAVSLVDTMSMFYQEPSLLVSGADTSVVFFIDRTSNSVMAVVHTSPQHDEVFVNAGTVAEGLYDLLPAYHDLTAEQRKTFESTVVNTEAHKSFVAVVDERLKNKKPVYDVDADYLAALRKLNLVITNTWFADAGGRSSAGSRTRGDAGDISSWLNVANNAIENQLYSYVDVFLTSQTPNESRELNMAPRNYILSQTPISFAQVPDSYYSIRVTQITDKARTENLAGAASKAVGMVVGKILGDRSSTCASNLISALSADFTALLTARNLNTTPEEDLENLFNVAGNATQTVLSNQTCLIKLFATGFLSRLNVLRQLWELGWVASDAIQLANLFKALKNHNELYADIQVYDGQLIMGQATFAAFGEMEESYETGETVVVMVEVSNPPGENFFERSGFAIQWETDVLTSTVDPLYGTTNEYGQATAQWKMPLEKIEGEAITLIANIKDKEGDDLSGSPVTFSTSLEDVVYTLAGVSFENIRDIGIPCPEMPKSCVYDVKVRFENPAAPTSGTILFRTIWDGDGEDGIYEGNINGSFGTLELQPSHGASNIVTLAAGFCWGRPKTQTKLQVKYRAKDGTETPLFEVGIPKPQ